MKKLITILTMIGMLLTFTATTMAEDGKFIKAAKCFCIDKWSTDYEMQAYCLKKQTKSITESWTLFSKYTKGSKELEIFHRAMTKWENKKCKAFDWDMVLYTFKKQLKAYNQMK